MMNEICQWETCTGCSACAETCPKDCIAMIPDGEGFLRPSIEKNLCVSCGLCQTVCPANNPIQEEGKEPDAYAVRNRDEKIRKVSSSGGVFSALAKRILAQGGAVIGAGFDEEYMVIHKVCTSESELDELRRSKYVQSDVHGTYRKTKEILQNGETVLFCGTPCQIGGLKAYLGIEYPNLYTADFICHGVPSPGVWKKYLEYRETEAGASVNGISFRSKAAGWQNYSMEIRFADHSKHCEVVSKDSYLRSFIMDMDLRPSCYQCQYKQLHRLSDVTLADFWGIERVYKNTMWNDDTGVSLVMIHSEKGHTLMKAAEVDLEAHPVSLREALACNPSMTQSVRKPALRERFMKDLHQLPYDKLHEKYCGAGIAPKIRRTLVGIIRK